jgi:hypothetical protein
MRRWRDAARWPRPPVVEPTRCVASRLLRRSRARRRQRTHAGPARPTSLSAHRSGCAGAPGPISQAGASGEICQQPFSAAEPSPHQAAVQAHRSPRAAAIGPALQLQNQPNSTSPPSSPSTARPGGAVDQRGRNRCNSKPACSRRARWPPASSSSSPQQPAAEQQLFGKAHAQHQGQALSTRPGCSVAAPAGLSGASISTHADQGQQAAPP